VVYQDHEDEKNSSEFFEANALMSKIFKNIFSSLPKRAVSPKSVKKNIFSAFQQSKKNENFEISF